MSDISTLSHEYEASAKLAEDLNEAILAIKKARLHRRAGLTPDQRKSLANTVESLRQLVKPHQDLGQSEFIPQEMVDRVRERNRPHMAYFLDDLLRTASALGGGSGPVDDEVVRTLDEICDAADETASAVFRRMRRR
jgi:hypothetical protein